MEPLPPGVIATALAGQERRALAPGPFASSPWRSAWAEAASRGRLAWGDPQWAAIGVDLQQVAGELADIAVVDDDALPAWADDLHWFLAHLRDDLPAPAPDAGPLDAILAASYAAALACIDDLRGDDRIPATWSRDVDAPIATALAGRMASAQARVLQPEVIAARALGRPVLEAAPDDWRERLIEFPALARPLGIAVASWRTGVLELVDHWARETAAEPHRIVTGIRLGLGDPHQGGRSVAMLRTMDGERHIHKPKPQGGAVVWQRIVEAVLAHPACADAGARAVPRLIRDRGDHGWDGYLARDPQALSDAEAARAWLRTFGTLVRICELLECRDMWLDNLITHDGLPAYIDVETVLQPRQQHGTAFDLIAETSLPTGAISLPIRLPDGRVEDIGVLRRPGEIALPFRREDLGGMTPIGQFGADGIMRWEPDPWRPELPPSVSVADEVLIGYDAVDQALGDAVLVGQLQALVRELAAQPSRVVLRSTFTCYSLMQDSLRPEVMHDGRARDIALASLTAPAVDAVVSGWPEAQARWLAALGRADALALARLDVPLVRHDPRTGALTLDDGTIAPAPEGRVPALELALARLRDPGRLRALRHTVVRAQVEIALAAGADAAGADAARIAHDGAIARMAAALAAELGDEHTETAIAAIAEFGYSPVSTSSSC